MKNNNIPFKLPKDYFASTISSEINQLIEFFKNFHYLIGLQKKDLLTMVTNEEDKDFYGNIVDLNENNTEEIKKILPILIYRLIENTLKKDLSTIFKSSTPEKISKANFEEIIKLFKKLTPSINFKSIDGYNIIDEIRMLNNCLKHNNDFISVEMSNEYPIWKNDELILISKVEQRLEDFEKGIQMFFESLNNQLLLINTQP